MAAWYCQVKSPELLESADEYLQTSLIPARRPPPDIISYEVWLNYRFNRSHRDIEDILAQRGVVVTRESVRLWCIKFGAIYSRRLKRKHRGYGDTFYIDEVFVKIRGKQYYLWRAVDQDGDVIDVYLQAKRDGTTAKRFFRRLLRSHGSKPSKIVTDKLRSYGFAHRELMPDMIHSTVQYENNRAEQSHEATRARERAMRRFKSTDHAQRFLGVHAGVSNLFNLGRLLVGAQHYRDLRLSAFNEWSRAVA
jgi:putative transposase